MSSKCSEWSPAQQQASKGIDSGAAAAASAALKLGRWAMLHRQPQDAAWPQ
jgi:hypothetical protein